MLLEHRKIRVLGHVNHRLYGLAVGNGVGRTAIDAYCCLTMQMLWRSKR